MPLLVQSKYVRFLLIFILVISIAGYLYYQNNAIETTHHYVTNQNIPEEFDGFTIVQVSDLHNKNYNGRLIEKIIQENPDIIAVTGDVIDRNRTNLPVAIEALDAMTELAPVYFVTGNHEVHSGLYKELREALAGIGVIDLDNDYDILDKEGAEIGLIGIEDPASYTDEEVHIDDPTGQQFLRLIQRNMGNTGTEYNILLSHRAEMMEIYALANVDVALTGHTHGGQIRLPLLNGLFAPSQGFFPKYTSGMYERDNTKMIVSRGLGNSIFPFRINNRPELVVVILKSE